MGLVLACQPPAQKDLLDHNSCSSPWVFLPSQLLFRRSTLNQHVNWLGSQPNLFGRAQLCWQTLLACKGTAPELSLQPCARVSPACGSSRRLFSTAFIHATVSPWGIVEHPRTRR